MFKKNYLTALIIVLFSTQVSQAATQEQMVAFVKKAVQHIREQGRDESFKKFNNQQDKEFHEGELYVFAYDYKGKNLSHGARASLIGQDSINLQDPDGTYVVKGLIKSLKAKGKEKGFFKYKWSNPLHNKVEPKLGYVEDIGGEYFVGSGIYLEK